MSGPNRIATSGRPKTSSMWVIFLLLLFLPACETTYQASRTVESAHPPDMSSTKIYFYPAQGQSVNQQDRDGYECYLWAVEKSGFNPAQLYLAPHQRVEVVPQTEPGENEVTGAILGAVAGSMMSPRGSRDEGAVFGAITGAILGSAVTEDQRRTAENIEQQLNSERYIVQEKQARNYRRAMTACLEGRGYTVR